MVYVIRPATIDDYAGVALVFDEIDRQHCEALPHIFRAVDGPALDRGYFEATLADAEAAWLAAERDGEIIGFVTVRAGQAPDRPFLVPRRYAHVENLVVRASDRHGGIGRALMVAAERWAAERGLREIQLNVWEFNRGAITFYEELGYVAERRTMRRIIDNGNS
jgi:ribosomal protein S18 acetylase RimI-like enzyme